MTKSLGSINKTTPDKRLRPRKPAQKAPIWRPLSLAQVKGDGWRRSSGGPPLDFKGALPSAFFLPGIPGHLLAGEGLALTSSDHLRSAQNRQRLLMNLSV